MLKRALLSELCGSSGFKLSSDRSQQLQFFFRALIKLVLLILELSELLQYRSFADTVLVSTLLQEVLTHLTNSVSLYL